MGPMILTDVKTAKHLGHRATLGKELGHQWVYMVDGEEPKYAPFDFKESNCKENAERWAHLRIHELHGSQPCDEGLTWVAAEDLTNQG